MRWNSRTWFWLSLILFLAAGYFWHLGNERVRKNKLTHPATQPIQPPPSQQGPATPPPASLKLLTAPESLAVNAPRQQPMRQSPVSVVKTSPGPSAAVLASSNQAGQPPAAQTRLSSYRLTNTSQPLADLIRRDTAILLRNAFLDTAEPMALAIPDSLRATGDPGSYIVQSRGPLNDAFRARLREAGATIVAYIPNNAYLVRLSATGAQQLAAWPSTQTVLPYEPYYKLEESLLKLALEQKPLSDGELLNLTLFPGEREAGQAALAALGAETVSESRSPFGPLFTIRPPKTGWVALAQLPSVKGVETRHPRQLLNDLTRLQLQVSSDPLTNGNYLGLTGSNILVNLNDSGVDAGHPDLKDRVQAIDPLYLTDPLGHGTHVAGIIASSGEHSDTVTNAPGSVTNANFRGLAPEAKLFVLPVDILTGPLISDTYLQETAARTNALISNNSWSYAGASQYDTAAASYDAAVRDALPDRPGSQPILFVFGAGNSGFGNVDGSGGEPGSIESPATAKNVITVGAVDHFRQITNEVVAPDDSGASVTNSPFLGETDSANQVTPFSSRGNVEIGVEGPSGRFKPDVVAPGAFVVSTRATGWQIDPNPTRVRTDRYDNQVVVPGALNNYFIFVPENAVQLAIRVFAMAPFTNVLVDLPLYLKQGDFPSTSDYNLLGTNEIVLPRDLPLAAGDWFYSVGNNGNDFVEYIVEADLVLTNAYGTRFEVLKTLDDNLGPYYRFDSGTSMSAPAVSGLLALMQEFFEQKLPADLRRTNSPALMKALLINGARSVNPLYDLQVRKTINQQGWGLVNLANSLPAALLNGSSTNRPLQFVDQDPTNAVATGESKTWSLHLSDAAQSLPLRVTLVWTDPPGDPNAALKLVNDLDLIVTNLDSGQVFYGNDIPAGSDFTQPWNTNTPSPSDVINNVENIFFREPAGTNFTLTVLGHRVNVNAVTANTNRTVQDYAWVVSSGDLEATNAFTLSLTTNNPISRRPLTTLTNGVPLLNERIGAHAPLTNSRSGDLNQWNFYVFTNTFYTNSFASITNGTNVAFVTFLPPNLARPRNAEADLDLYVSTNPALTNLDAAVLAAADKSTNRGGTEVVFYTNAPLDEVFYVGVKSEDQQGAEYSFVALSSNQPFDEDVDGNRILHGMPVNVEIPDGSPDQPGGAYMFAIATRPFIVGRVVLTNIIAHQDLGDLVGNLSHSSQFVILNNHSLNNGNFSGTNILIYDDSNQGDIFYSRPSDGPGHLSDFIGAQSSGLWLLTMVDDALGHTGRVQNMEVRLDPEQAATGLLSTVLANQFDYFIADVPPEANQLTITVWDMDPQLPLNLYIRRGDLPTTTVFDKSALINPPNGSLTLGLRDVPPLSTGRYYVGVFNPNPVPVTYRITAELEYNLAGGLVQTFSPTNTPLLIQDDALTLSTNHVAEDREVVDVRVGVRIDHPRVADLVLHLVSPQGTRVLLVENRGGLTTNGFGLGDANTGISYLTFTENTNLAKTLIKFALPPFTNSISGTTLLTEGFEASPATNYLAGQTFNGWTVLTNNVAVVTEAILADSGTNWLNLRAGGLSRPLPTTIGKDYVLSFSYRQSPPLAGLVSWWPLEGKTNDIVDGNSATIVGPMTFAPGLVGQAFSFDGVNNYAVINASPNLNVPSLTLETWILPADLAVPHPIFEFAQKIGFAGVHLWTGVPGSSSVPNALYANLRAVGFDGTNGNHVIRSASNVLLPNQWNHVALTYDQLSGAAFLYVNGTTVVATNLGVFIPQTGWPLYFGYRPVGSSDVGALTYFQGRMDEPALFNRALSAAEIQDIYRAGSLGKCGLSTPPGLCLAGVQVSLNGLVTNGLVGSPAWQSFSLPFKATTNPTLLEFGASPGGIMLDSISLAEQGLAYFPEESIDLFKHERSLGDWKLELWDNRVGATNPAPRLMGWQLQLIFATPRQTAVTLSNGVPYTSIASGLETRYFIVDVPRAATYATNTLVGTGDLILIGDRRGLPVGDQFIDEYYVDQYGAGGGEYLLLSTNFPLIAPLQPGGRYYLGVKNKNPSETNFFTIQVDFDRVDVPTNLLVTPLINGIAITNTMAHGPVLDYYQFTVSPNAIAAQFELIPFNGDVNLLLRKATPVIDPLPTVSRYDYRSTNPGTNAEVIILATNSFPIPLTPGVWYVGVFNVDNFPVSYSIRATEVTSLPVNIIDLTNSVPLRFRLKPGALTDFFRFRINETNVAARFQLLQMNGNADLILRQGQLPSLTNYDTGSFNLSTSDEQIFIRTNSAGPADLLTTNLNGDWYLAALNREAIPVDLTLRATVTPHFTWLTNEVVLTNTVASGPAWRYYQFAVSSNATMAVFAANPLDGDIALLVRQARVGPEPWPTLTDYDYFSDGFGPSLEEVIVFSNSSPVGLSPGTWYLAVYNPGLNPVTFTIGASEFSDQVPTIIPLVNGIAHPNTITDAPQYYSFTVTPAASWAAFEILQPSGNVNLLLKKGLPLLNSTNFDYQSSNAGTKEERILVYTNSAPVGLAPGTWFLRVDNLETSSVAYSIVANEFVGQPPAIIPLTNGVAYAHTVTNSPDFYSFTLSSNAAWASFEVLQPRGNVNLFLRKGLPLPTPFVFDYQSANRGTNEELIVLFPNSQPVPLTAGTWYLGVYNQESFPVSYTILATESLGQAPLVIPLTNGLPYTRQIALTNALDYYLFIVSATATQAVFRTLGADGDVDVFVHKGLPLPGPGNFHYLSANPGTNDERITVETNSTPMGLSPGIWFLSVSNADVKPVNYSILATEFRPPPSTNVVINVQLIITSNMLGIRWNSQIGTNYYVEGRTNLSDPQWNVLSPTLTATNTVMTYWIPLPTPYQFFRVVQGTAPITVANPTIVTLTNGVPFRFTVGTNNVLTNLFLFRITDTNVAARFVLDNLSGNADLILRQTQFPSVTNLDAGSFNPGTNEEHILIRTNAGTGTPPLFTNLVINPIPAISTNSICFAWSSQAGMGYFLQARTNLDDAEWTTVSPTNLAVEAESSYCLDWPSPYRFFRVVQLVLVPTELAVTNLNGVWYLAVLNKEQVPVAFTIQATVTPHFIVLTNAVAITNTLGPGPVWQYYEFTVSSNATRLTVDAVPDDGDLALLARQSAPIPAPWPTLSDFDYLSNQSGTNAEQIVVSTNSPVPLSAGLWYLGVYNADTNPVTYSIRAAEDVPVAPTNLVILPRLDVTNNTLCLTWNSTPGAFYQVEGRVKIDDPAWNLIATNILATATETTYCISLTGSNRFYRVVQVPTGPVPPALVIHPQLILTTNSFGLTWDSIVGAIYQVQGRVYVNDTNWNIISTNIVATATQTTYFVPLSNPNRFFRVVQLPAGSPPAPVIDPSALTLTTNGFVLKWTAPSNQRFQVQFATNLPPVWSGFTNIVTSTNGVFSFIDDGSQSAGLNGPRFYRLLLLP